MSAPEPPRQEPPTPPEPPVESSGCGRGGEGSVYDDQTLRRYEAALAQGWEPQDNAQDARVLGKRTPSLEMGV